MIFVDPLLPFRATGRTWNMMKAAVEAATHEGTVYVIAATDAQFDHLRATLLSVLEELGMTARVSRDTVVLNKGIVRFISWNDPMWSWEERRVKGAALRAPVFIDHSALEYHFPRVIQEWARLLR